MTPPPKREGPREATPEARLDALDALADILTEHCRLRDYADPFLMGDPDD